MSPARLFGSALFFALLAASEAHYSAQRGPTLLGIAEATLGLACAVLAWQRAADGWAAWRRGVAWQRAIDRATGNGGHP